MLTSLFSDDAERLAREVAMTKKTRRRRLSSSSATAPTIATSIADLPDSTKSVRLPTKPQIVTKENKPPANAKTMPAQQQQQTPQQGPSGSHRRRSTGFCDGMVSPSVSNEEKNVILWKHRVEEILNRDETEVYPAYCRSKQSKSKKLSTKQHPQVVESNYKSCPDIMANEGLMQNEPDVSPAYIMKQSKKLNQQESDNFLKVAMAKQLKNKRKTKNLQRRRRRTIEVSHFSTEEASVILPPQPFADPKQKEISMSKKLDKKSNSSSSSDTLNALPGDPHCSTATAAASSAFDKIAHRPNESFYSARMNTRMEESPLPNKAVLPRPRYRRRSIEVSCPECPFKNQKEIKSHFTAHKSKRSSPPDFILPRSISIPNNINSQGFLSSSSTSVSTTLSSITSHTLRTNISNNSMIHDRRGGGEGNTCDANIGLPDTKKLDAVLSKLGNVQNVMRCCHRHSMKELLSTNEKMALQNSVQQHPHQKINDIESKLWQRGQQQVRRRNITNDVHDRFGRPKCIAPIVTEEEEDKMHAVHGIDRHELPIHHQFCTTSNAKKHNERTASLSSTSEENAPNRRCSKSKNMGSLSSLPALFNVRDEKPHISSMVSGDYVIHTCSSDNIDNSMSSLESNGVEDCPSIHRRNAIARMKGKGKVIDCNLISERQTYVRRKSSGTKHQLLPRKQQPQQEHKMSQQQGRFITSNVGDGGLSGVTFSLEQIIQDHQHFLTKVQERHDMPKRKVMDANSAGATATVRSDHAATPAPATFHDSVNSKVAMEQKRSSRQGNEDFTRKDWYQPKSRGR